MTKSKRGKGRRERGRVRTREEDRVETLVKGDSAGQDRKTLCYDFFI